MCIVVHQFVGRWQHFRVSDLMWLDGTSNDVKMKPLPLARLLIRHAGSQVSSSATGLDGVILGEDFVTKNVLSARSVPVSPTLLPWDRFSHWVHCICIVTFDLELGQVLEILYPGHVKLTEREKTNICYLSFPDSNSGCIGDTQFHFRIRQCPGRRAVIPVHAQYNFECPTALQIDPSYFYGYVYFRQVKDRSLRRGYFQKSVVLLTRLPFVSLFYKLVEIIAPEFFENAEPSVEAACHDIDQWPPPTPGSVLNIPIVGNVLQIRIPSLSDKPGSAQPSGSPIALPCTTAPIVLPTIHELEAFRYFWPIVSHIHLLWELVITGEPIVVMAASPTICSGMVQALISMLSPLKYCGDFRPFFTIHDSEFKEYTTKAQAPPPVILGVTNPFFAKTLQHWPHIIRLEDSTPNCFSPIHQKQKVKKGTSLKTRESKPGVYTRYKPFLQKDKMIMKKLLKGVQLCRPVQVQNSILRRHLLELTQSFMIPLERYMASLMPLQRNISPHKSTPTLRPFNPDDFLKTIETSGPNLTSGIKGDWTGLYRRFFRSTNFSGWYNARHKEATRKLEALHLEVLRDADLMLWIRDKQEVEVVDLILKIKQKLESANADNLPVEPSTVQRLRARLEDILSTLPEDLQSVLRAS